MYLEYGIWNMDDDDDDDDDDEDHFRTWDCL